MASAKKTITIAFIITIIFIGIAVVIYIFRCNIFKNLASCVPDPNKTNDPLPAGATGTKWIPETAPYKIGMWGPKIKALQNALGILADGKFGNQTNAAIIAKGYTVPLSQVDYNAIVGTNTGIGGTLPINPGNVIGRKVYAKDQIVHIRSTPDVNDGIFNNKVCELALNYEPAPTISDMKDCSKAGTGCIKINNYYWYQIQFQIANCSSKAGWVRQDVVTVK